MGVFGKDGEYIDYTLLKKRGLLKAREDELKSQVNEEGVLDLTSAYSIPSLSSSPSSVSSSASPFDMLSSLASANSSSSSSYPSNSYPTHSLSSSSDSAEVNALKLKIEDLEYKLNALIDKIDKMNLK